MCTQFLLELSSGKDRPDEEAHAFHLYGIPRFEVQRSSNVNKIPRTVIKDVMKYSKCDVMVLRGGLRKRVVRVWERAGQSNDSVMRVEGEGVCGLPSL